MKALAGVLLALALAAVLGVAISDDPGYVLLRLGHWRVESSVVLLVAAVILGYLAFALLLGALRGVVRAPGALRHWRLRRRRELARRDLDQGLLLLAQGRWQQAERRLLGHAGAGPSPANHYLAAARAAQAQGALERRDRYLAAASQQAETPATAVALTQAELQNAQGQHEQALATLERLLRDHPGQPQALRMLSEALTRLADWPRLERLLPELRRRQALDSEALHRLERAVHAGLLERAGRAGDLEALREAWRHLPARLAEDVDFEWRYASLLAQLGDPAGAEAILRPALRRRWHQGLIDLYSRLPTESPERQLETLEAWLTSRPEDPVLLSALGRIAGRAELWGKARQYLEASLALTQNQETYRLLGELLDRTGEGAAAADCYRKGMALSAPSTPADDLGSTPGLPQGTASAG